jgi:hypothetical protein
MNTNIEVLRELDELAEAGKLRVDREESHEISGYTCTVPDNCETLHWRGQILSMNELASVAQPAGDECHCGTCTCDTNMTPAVRFDLSPAQKEGAIHEHLIRLGWTPPEASATLQAEIEALRAEMLRELEECEQRDEALLRQALDALIWTTGSEDFSDGGLAREGALKLLFPTIAALRERLSEKE